MSQTISHREHFFELSGDRYMLEEGHFHGDYWFELHSETKFGLVAEGEIQWVPDSTIWEEAHATI